MRTLGRCPSFHFSRSLTSMSADRAQSTRYWNWRPRNGVKECKHRTPGCERARSRALVVARQDKVHGLAPP
eukprot:13929392-Alexandrium_andersonii.AAC.1